MSDIPNPLAAFDIFSARVDEKKQKKAKANPLKKLFSKKVAKKVKKAAKKAEAKVEAPAAK